jgi:hypothetical protein
MNNIRRRKRGRGAYDGRRDGEEEERKMSDRGDEKRKRGKEK